jgi:hypothetical protein
MTKSNTSMISEHFNVILSFVLELLMLGAVGYWGYSLPLNVYGKWICAILVPALLTVVWGLFFAPRANVRMPTPWLLTCELVLFCGSAIALHTTDKSNLALPLAGLIAINVALTIAWKQY